MGRKSLSTMLIHAGAGNFQRNMIATESVPETFPLYMTSVYSFEDAARLEAIYEGTSDGYIYSRMGAPNADATSEILARADGGEAALLFASGMAAIATSVFSCVGSGDHILASRTLYGGVYDYFSTELNRFGVEVTFADLSLEGIETHIRPNTKLLYTETISNPLMEVADMAALAATARKHDLLFFVDNTFATPAIFRPLDFGADAALYSATKYLGGHSDIIAGAVVANAALIKRIRRRQTLYGPSPGPLECWLLARSLRTLDLRLGKHSENGLKIASFLENQPQVDKVFYPGLPLSPFHELARRQFTEGRFGGMLSLNLKGGERAAEEMLRHMRMIALVPSLAGVATSVSIPARTSHRAYSREKLEEMGIAAGQLRFSAGLEDAGDIIAELAKGIEAAAKTT